mmetsp:Transcript_15332/g.38072  ORF Transcript_15332/g.38072 Transcript_15332/m.38072 type:complete len:122 (+) Transcript_15332:3-368(+)
MLEEERLVKQDALRMEKQNKERARLNAVKEENKQRRKLGLEELPETLQTSPVPWLPKVKDKDVDRAILERYAYVVTYDENGYRKFCATDAPPRKEKKVEEAEEIYRQIQAMMNVEIGDEYR